jgi:hypothetical protein
LQMRVKDQLLASTIVHEDIIQLSRPPTWRAYTYERMWAYANHYHVDIESRLRYLTYGFGVACIFRQASCSSTWDQNFVMGNLNYVRVLKEILIVDYAGLPIVLFKCSWILANIRGNATIRHDEHGFWMVNLARQLSPIVEPYVFPTFVTQEVSA